MRNIEERDCGHATPCHVWTGYTQDGYARTRRNGRSVLLHRWAFEQKHGPVPAGLQLDHLCRNRSCVNPDHLEPVTGAENLHRSPWAKLSSDAVREIRESSLSCKRLGEKFGVSHMTVWQARTHKTWVGF